jgi:hypothetical protein
MKLNNISLPYPVLGISDDITPLLKEDCVIIENTSNAVEYCFVVTLKIENDDILSLINDGYAEYSCEVDCVGTLLRRSYASSDGKITIKISRKHLVGRVFFNSFVSVKKTIKNYKNKGFNVDYTGFSFDMEPGDILVAFPQSYYDADIKYDKLQAAGSFMQIREGVGKDFTTFDFESDKIDILLPTPIFEMYKNGLGNQFSMIIHSSLAYNALTCALYNIDKHKTTTWAKTIFYRMEHEDDLRDFLPEDIEQDARIENVPELAMRLLKDPYARMFNYLNELNQRMGETE